MKDIRKLVQEVLDAVFYGVVPVYAEDAEEEQMPDEYIVFDVVYSLGHSWANGRTVSIREGVDVTYCCRRRGQKPARLRQIMRTMTDAGFDVVEGFADIPRGEITGYYGAVAEFALVRVVVDDAD